MAKTTTILIFTNLLRQRVKMSKFRRISEENHRKLDIIHMFDSKYSVSIQFHNQTAGSFSHNFSFLFFYTAHFALKVIKITISLIYLSTNHKQKSYQNLQNGIHGPLFLCSRHTAHQCGNRASSIHHSYL